MGRWIQCRMRSSKGAMSKQTCRIDLDLDLKPSKFTAKDSSVYFLLMFCKQWASPDVEEWIQQISCNIVESKEEHGQKDQWLYSVRPWDCITGFILMLYSDIQDNHICNSFSAENQSCIFCINTISEEEKSQFVFINCKLNGILLEGWSFNLSRFISSGEKTPRAVELMTGRSPGPGPSFDAGGGSITTPLGVQSERTLSVRRVSTALLIISQDRPCQ